MSDTPMLPRQRVKELSPARLEWLHLKSQAEEERKDNRRKQAALCKHLMTLAGRDVILRGDP